MKLPAYQRGVVTPGCGVSLFIDPCFTSDASRLTYLVLQVLGTIQVSGYRILSSLPDKIADKRDC